VDDLVDAIDIRIVDFDPLHRQPLTGGSLDLAAAVAIDAFGMSDRKQPRNGMLGHLPRAVMNGKQRRRERLSRQIRCQLGLASSSSMESEHSRPVATIELAKADTAVAALQEQLTITTRPRITPHTLKDARAVQNVTVDAEAPDNGCR
jgi:hypothetical protein